MAESRTTRAEQLVAWKQGIDELFDVVFRSGRSEDEINDYLFSKQVPAVPIDDMQWVSDDLFGADPPLTEEQVRANAAAPAVVDGVLSREEACYIVSVPLPVIEEWVQSVEELDAEIRAQEEGEAAADEGTDLDRRGDT